MTNESSPVHFPVEGSSALRTLAGSSRAMTIYFHQQLVSGLEPGHNRNKAKCTQQLIPLNAR